MTQQLLKILIIVSVFTIIMLVIPQSYTAAINDSLVYFLSFLWKLDAFMDVSVFLQAVKAFIEFQVGIAVILIFHSIMKTFSSSV